MMNRFLQRHFSLMLALRYLNPLRTYFSVITLICLLGVSLGVMVLVVVLSVMGGLQREIKDRFLTYAPHVTVMYSPVPGVVTATNQWREAVDQLKKTPGVETAYPQIEDYVLVDASGAQKPSLFRAIDTESEAQMKELAPLITAGSFDMGLGEEAVISSSMASNMGIHVGDTLRVYAKRNYEDVISAYMRSEKALKIQEKDQLELLSRLWEKPVIRQDLEWIPTEKVESAADTMRGWAGQELVRPSESKALSEALDILENPVKSEKGDSAFAIGSGKKYLDSVNAIRNLDADKEDLAAFKQVKSVILPRDLEVIGIYQSSRHMSSPEIFLPLTIGQELLGFEDAAQGIAVRAIDPHKLEPVEKAVGENLPKPLHESGSWLVRNWMDNPSIASFISLMQQERVMISFVLFFITLVASFCIMAVMFAMSIQRKKEIAVMRALGATPRQVTLVFLWQGLVIGFVGSALGVILGLVVLHYRVQIREFLVMLNFDPFPVGFHGVQIPAFVNVNEIILISIVSFVLVVVASIIPAIMTARQDPARSLRSL